MCVGKDIITECKRRRVSFTFFGVLEDHTYVVVVFQVLKMKKSSSISTAGHILYEVLDIRECRHYIGGEDKNKGNINAGASRWAGCCARLSG